MAVSRFSSFNPHDSDEEFLREEDEAEWADRGKSLLLVVFDVTPPMFESWFKDKEDEETPFLAAVKCCEAMWRNKIVSNPQDLVGILLVGSEQSSENVTFPGIYEMQELSTVTVGMIKELMGIRNDPANLNGFMERIGSSEEFSMKDLFWQAKMCFDKAKSQNFRKKVMIFTAQDDPNGSKPSLQEDAVNKFKDLGDVDLTVVAFKEDFQYAKFYNRLNPDESSLVQSKDLESLKKIMRMKQRLRRPISRAVLELAEGVRVGIGFYSFVRKAMPPKAVTINKRNNEVVEKSVNTFRVDTGMPVLKSEERKMITVQGESTVLTTQEVKEMRLKGRGEQATGVKIIGFMRKEDFDHFSWYRSPPYFLYPDESRITGSKELFTTLLQRCHALERVALVKYVLSRGKSQKLGILIPSVPEEATKKSLFPQGFHLFPVPFADEVRKYEKEYIPDTPPELVSLMERIVKRLTSAKFDVLEVRDPKLQHLWRRLEEEALEEEVQDPADLYDFTEPNEALMQERLSQKRNLPAEIEQQVELLGTTYSASRSSAPCKKPRIDVEVEARHGRLLRCTVAELKEYLTGRGVEVPVISGKPYLINLINTLLFR